MAFQLTLSGPGIAVVFGGSGGVDSAICRRLAEAGSSVAVTYHRNERNALKLRDELTQLGVASKRGN